MFNIVSINKYTAEHRPRGSMRCMVAREHYEEGSLGIGNGILRMSLELRSVGLWYGNILVIAAREQLR